MAQTLVLVRHAKPVSSAPSVADAERPLTPEGLAAVEESFPATFALLGDARATARIWSSPAVRAWQTAEAVAEALGRSADEIEEHLTIYAQDEDAFLEEVAACEDAIVIAVGHIPMMEDLVADLAGFACDFNPGGVAAVEIVRALDEFQPARLLWFVQGPKVGA